MPDNPTPFSLGEYTIYGNSDFIKNYEMLELFQPGSSIGIGIEGETIQTYCSSVDDQKVMSISCYSIPNPNSSKQNGQSKSSLTLVSDNDPTLQSLSLKGFDVAQSPIQTDGDSSIKLIAYGVGQDNKLHVAFWQNPLDSGTKAIDLFQFDSYDPNKMVRGFFAGYEGVVQDQLADSYTGNIQVQLNTPDKGNLTFELSNTDIFSSNLFMNKLEDFGYSYSLSGDTTDLIYLALLVDTDDHNKNPAGKKLIIVGYDVANETRFSPQIVDFGDSNFEPQSVVMLQSSVENIQDVYVGGNTSSGYAVYKVIPSNSNNTPPEVSQLFSTKNGVLSEFAIGLNNDKLEFWGVVNYSYNISNKPTNVSVLCRANDLNESPVPVPLLAIDTFSVVENRGTGGLDIFVVPSNANEDLAPYINLSHSLINYGGGAKSLVHIWTDHTSGLWRSQPIKLPSKEARSYGSSSTYVTVQDAKTNRPASKVTFQISSKAREFVRINNQSYQLQPGKYIDVNSDTLGRLTFTREVSALQSSTYLISYQGFESALEIDALSNAQYNMANPSQFDKDQQDTAKKLAGVAQTKKGSEFTVFASVNRNIYNKSAVKAAKTSNSSDNNYVAVAFGKNGPQLYTDASSFNNRTIVTPSPPPEGWLDDLWDDVKSAFDTIEKDVGTALTVAESFVHKIESIVVKGVEMTINFVDSVLNVVLDTLEHVWDGIKLFFQKIAEDIEKLIKFIGFLLDGHDMLNTSKVLSTYINLGMQNAAEQCSKGSSLHQKVDQIFNGIEKKLDGGKTPSNSNDPTKTSKAQGNVQGNSGINMILQHVTGGSGNVDSYTTTGVTVKDFEKLAEDTGTLIENFGKDLIKDVSDFSNFSSNIKSSMSSLSTELAGVVDDSKVCIDDIITGIGTDITALNKLGNETIEIPLLTKLFEDITGETPTMINIFGLILGIPATILFKIMTDRAPFTDETANKLIGAKTYSEFTSNLGIQQSDLLANSIGTSGKLSSGNPTSKETEMLAVKTGQSSATASAEAPAEDGGTNVLNDISQVIGLADAILEFIIFAVELGEEAGGEEAEEGEGGEHGVSKFVKGLIITASLFEFTLWCFSFTRDEDENPEAAHYWGFYSFLRTLVYVLPNNEEQKGFIVGIDGFLTVVGTLLTFDVTDEESFWQVLDNLAMLPRFGAEVAGVTAGPEVNAVVQVIDLVLDCVRVAHAASEDELFG